MSEGRVTLGAAGELRLSGVLDYQTGPALLGAGKTLIDQSTASPVVVDCSAVEKSTSVGISLLLAYMRQAARKQRTLRVIHLPEEMLHIAEVSGLKGILPVEG